MDLDVRSRLTMKINCPCCSNRFKFLDLYLFRLKGYKIQCNKCGREYHLNGCIDASGLLLIAVLLCCTLALTGLIVQLVSEYFVIADIVEILIITFILVLILAVIIYGHPAYLVWYMKKMYQKDVNDDKQ